MVLNQSEALRVATNNKRVTNLALAKAQTRSSERANGYDGDPKVERVRRNVRVLRQISRGRVGLSLTLCLLDLYRSRWGRLEGEGGVLDVEFHFPYI